VPNVITSNKIKKYSIQFFTCLILEEYYGLKTLYYKLFYITHLQLSSHYASTLREASSTSMHINTNHIILDKRVCMKNKIHLLLCQWLFNTNTEHGMEPQLEHPHFIHSNIHEESAGPEPSPYIQPYNDLKKKCSEVLISLYWQLSKIIFLLHNFK
jgi:hypothetical protein